MIELAGIDSLPNLGLALTILVALVLLGSLGAVWYLDRPAGRLGELLRRRFVMGVPWGTLVIVAFVLGMYLFVQGGYERWYDPMVVPFRSWSYFYPLGVVTAPFSHRGAGHLLGNLFGTIALAPIAEYAWGHFPQERGQETFRSWRTNPWIRAFVLFPGGVLAVGLATGLFSLGPIIGFSAVVFAFAGFALVRYPLTTVVAALAGPSTLSLIYNALNSPSLTVTPSPRPPTAPWWAEIAIQGHAIGLLIGVLLGVALLWRRGHRPDAWRIWLAALVFAADEALWAVYWFRGDETFVLYRGPGLVLIALLALVVTLAVTTSDREVLGTLSSRQVWMSVLLLSASALAGPAIATNFLTVGSTSTPEASVQAGDYTVYYDENVENRMVSVVEIDAFGETTAVKTSGVIVVSEDRHIWTREVSKGRLAFSGRASVTVGGVGWRERIGAIRRGWSAVGGETAYMVWLDPPDDGRRLAFVSDPARAEPLIAGRNVSVVPAEGSFYLAVTRNNSTVDSAPLASLNETDSVRNVSEATPVGGLHFLRVEDRIYAIDDGTVVRVAEKETYK
ncbi:MAG: rhomboid family intramembrane serine protease [Halodesulfurarchaeum sp.]